MANILSTANSALVAAQAGLATTAHNIANQKTAGYNRQVVLQAAVAGQNEGGGFIGKGTEVVSVRRVYNEFLAAQVRTVQTNQSQFEAHYTQANRINSMLADPTSGLSPVLEDFFQSVHDLTGNPDGRGSLLATAQSMAARFQSMDGQLRELRTAVNGEVANTITAINSYAKQIGDLNDAISNAQSGSGQPPNDLLDQRDYLVGELSKLTKVTVSKDGTSYGIFIGNGQPMVVGNTVAKLEATPSSTDLSEITVGLATGAGTIRLSEGNLQGGKLGGLLEFRATTLTNAQNALGRIALGLATTFNDQHKLGLDANGAVGGNFFGMGQPVVNTNRLNTGTGVLNASVTDVNALKASDYKVGFDGANYNIVRLSDKTVVSSTPGPLTAPGITVDGVNVSLSAGTMNAGDYFIVKPTIAAAGAFSVLVSDPNNIAAAAPINTSSPMTNTGSAKISAGSVDATFNATTFFGGPPPTPRTLTYSAPVAPATVGTLSGFPAGPVTADVPMTIGGVTYAAGAPLPAGPIPYAPGATLTFGGVSVSISGMPKDGDTFVISPNTAVTGDTRNMGLLAKLQTTDTLIGGTVNYQGALAAMVSDVGNKTHELEVGTEAQTNLVSQLRQAQDADSGVNLDEEGANLLRYQQAYIAAGKVMQAVKEMFDALVAIGA